MRTFESSTKNAIRFTERNRLRVVPSEANLILALVSNGIDFIHQYPFITAEKYWIADFCIPNANLIVEVDGVDHFQDAIAAKDRCKESLMIKDYGYSVVRFNNEQAINEPSLIIDFILNHVPSNVGLYDKRIVPVLKSSIEDTPTWNAIPVTGCKDGEVKEFLSIARALNYYKIPQSQYTTYFRNNHDKSTYTSKTGITLTKTTLL